MGNSRGGEMIWKSLADWSIRFRQNIWLLVVAAIFQFGARLGLGDTGELSKIHQDSTVALVAIILWFMNVFPWLTLKVVETGIQKPAWFLIDGLVRCWKPSFSMEEWTERKFGKRASVLKRMEMAW